MTTVAEVIYKLEYERRDFNDRMIDYGGVNEAYDMAIRSLEAWEKVKADIAETILHYKDWGQVELKAQYKKEALEEVLDCINRLLKEVTE